MRPSRRSTAGVDMEMVSRLFASHLPRLVKEGKVRETAIDEAVRRILRIKFRLGLFEHPYADEAREAERASAPGAPGRRPRGRRALDGPAQERGRTCCR